MLSLASVSGFIAAKNSEICILSQPNMTKITKKGRLGTSATFRLAHSLLYATADAEPGLGSL
jgi:hypothetical protein